MSDNVTISIQAHTHGPTGTANRLHLEVKALLEAMGYTLDGAMHVRVESDQGVPEYGKADFYPMPGTHRDDDGHVKPLPRHDVREQL